MTENVKILRKATSVDVVMKFNYTEQLCGWVVISYTIMNDYWVWRFKSMFSKMVFDCQNSIGLIASYNTLTKKIKYMANANEFVSRLALVDASQISYEILLHLKQTFGFDHVILPEVKQFDLSFPAATVYVPKHVHNILASIDIESLLIPPYDPVVIHHTDEKIDNFIKKLMKLYHVKQCYLFPIVNQSRLAGFY